MLPPGRHGVPEAPKTTSPSAERSSSSPRRVSATPIEPRALMPRRRKSAPITGSPVIGAASARAIARAGSSCNATEWSSFASKRGRTSSIRATARLNRKAPRHREGAAGLSAAASVLQVVCLVARGVRGVAGGLLRLAERALRLTFGFFALVAGQLAFGFLDLAFDAIFVHVNPFT